jgi:hypothetical protein
MSTMMMARKSDEHDSPMKKKCRKRYRLTRKAGPKCFGLSTNSTAIKQRRYRLHDAAGLKHFPGLGYVEPGLVQHVLYSVTDKLPVIVGVHSQATLKRVLEDHLRNQWIETWRAEWVECGGEIALPQPCADLPLWFWS